MKVLILGDTGLLGRELFKQWSGRYEVWTMNRRAWDAGSRLGPLEYLIHESKIDVIVNCVGITKAKIKDPAEAIEVNALFPHKLAEICKKNGSRLIHISTDCVFSGEIAKEEGYTEKAAPDPGDLYGRSKLLGEPEGCVVLRTSFIGRHPEDKTGLVEWLLQNVVEGKYVTGYVNAQFSGLTTIALARAIERVLLSEVAEGLWHVGGYKISKYNLLRLLREVYIGSAWVGENVSTQYNRSLVSSKFRSQFEYQPPTWETMIAELVREYPL